MIRAKLVVVNGFGLAVAFGIGLLIFFFAKTVQPPAGSGTARFLIGRSDMLYGVDDPGLKSKPVPAGERNIDGAMVKRMKP